MPNEKTHRQIKEPQIGIRYLAEYMNGSDRARRTLLRRCKYQPIARVIQHKEAKLSVSYFLRNDGYSLDDLVAEAEKIRNRIADTDFDAALYSHNADYLIRFSKIADDLKLPTTDVSQPGKMIDTSLHGTRVTASLDFRLRRVTKTNKVRVGAGMLRYAKGKKVNAAEAQWQSALMFGLLRLPGHMEDGADPELKLCITLDAYSGDCYPAPSDAVSRFQNAEAACATIADAWGQIQPPKGAVL